MVKPNGFLLLGYRFFPPGTTRGDLFLFQKQGGWLITVSRCCNVVVFVQVQENVSRTFVWLKTSLKLRAEIARRRSVELDVSRITLLSV